MLPAVSLASLSLCCLLVSGGSVRGDALEDAVDRGHASLNEMFREVEMLMEDTQQILEEAVDQIATESAKSSLSSLDLLSSYHNDSKRTGNRTALSGFDEETINSTGETRPSHSNMGITGNWNSAEHECMVDEDCGGLEYCLYEIENSRCLPCIPTDMPCTKDEECCSEDMCVYGQCTANATRGTEGSICQVQTDCRQHLCCAFMRELLFPVCTPRPERGESCLSQPNLLMDMLAWDQEGPRDHCPCAPGLQCHAQGRGALCGK